MKEQLISFETAKLAERKGFNIDTIPIVYQKSNGSRIYLNGGYDSGEDAKRYTSAPTQSLLQKWLREKHDIHININTYYFEDLQKYGYEVEDIIHPEGWVVINNPKKTYEEALEKGLQEALKLIKL